MKTEGDIGTSRQGKSGFIWNKIREKTIPITRDPESQLFHVEELKEVPFDD